MKQRALKITNCSFKRFRFIQIAIKKSWHWNMPVKTFELKCNPWRVKQSPLWAKSLLQFKHCCITLTSIEQSELRVENTHRMSISWGCVGAHCPLKTITPHCWTSWFHLEWHQLIHTWGISYKHFFFTWWLNQTKLNSRLNSVSMQSAWSIFKVFLIKYWQNTLLQSALSIMEIIISVFPLSAGHKVKNHYIKYNSQVQALLTPFLWTNIHSSTDKQDVYMFNLNPIHSYCWKARFHCLPHLHTFFYSLE